MNIVRKWHCLVVASIIILASCANNVNRGHLKEDEAMAKVKAGVSTRGDVLNALGSPSSESSFGNKTWFYITTIKETRSIMPPKVIDQKVTEIAFDAGDMVTSIKQYSLADGKDIEIAKRVTPSEGQQLGFFEQIFANLGRFNKDDSNGASNNHGNRSGTSPTGYPTR